MVSQLCLTLDVFVGSFFGFFFLNPKIAPPSPRKDKFAALPWRPQHQNEPLESDSGHTTTDSHVPQMSIIFCWTKIYRKWMTHHLQVNSQRNKTWSVFPTVGRVEFSNCAVALGRFVSVLSDNERDQCHPNGPVSLMMAPGMIFLVRRWNLSFRAAPSKLARNYYRTSQ